MSQPQKPISDDRPLTNEELRLTLWMLENGKPEGIGFVQQLHRARVVSRCPCGCASIDFAIDGCQIPKGGMQILGDFAFGDGDETCGAFVFEKDGILAGLEVYGFAVDAPKTLPEPKELRRFP